MQGIKKFLGLVMVCACTFLFGKSVSALGVEVKTVGTRDFVFANGNDIVIDSENNQTVIRFGSETRAVSDDAVIFGGSHNSDDVIENTKIIMIDGKVSNIFGGGLHKSTVNNAKIYVNGGEVTGQVLGGGAASYNRINCGDVLPDASNKNDSKTIVNNTEVTINGGKIGIVYGGGEGISYTKNAIVNINGGVMDYVIGSGSNGYTDSTTMNILGGTIDIVHTVNRGTLEYANLVVNDNAYINNLYAVSVGDDATGELKNATIEVNGGKVENFEIGNDNFGDVSISYIGSSVKNASDDIKNKSISYVKVTINGQEFKVLSGTPLKDAISLEEFKIREGKEFLKFIVEDTNEDFDENTIIENDVILKSVFIDPAIKDAVNGYKEPDRDNEPDNNVKTADNVLVYGLITILGISGLGVATKKIML